MAYLSVPPPLLPSNRILSLAAYIASPNKRLHFPASLATKSCQSDLSRSVVWDFREDPLKREEMNSSSSLSPSLLPRVLMQWFVQQPFGAMRTDPG